MTDRRNMIAYIVPMGAGLDTFVYREVEALFERGYRIHLFSTKYVKRDVFSPKPDWPLCALTPSNILFRLPRMLFGLLTHPLILLSAIRDRGLIDFVFALGYAPVMVRTGVRQIHCHFGDHKLFIGYYCKLLTGLPLSVTIHAHEFYTQPNPVLFRKALAVCDGVFPIAEKWKKILVEEYKVNEDKVRLNRLFVDVSTYKPADEVRIIAVGRFTERKGYHYLIEAISRLKDIGVHLILVGFGDMDLRGIAERFCVSDRVTIYEKLDQAQLRHLYQSSDILCVPSITTDKEGAEGIPVVLMEGMACGLPVVATRCGAIDELVEDIIVAERSLDQLEDAIRRLATDEELRKQQGSRNREIIRQQYSVDNVIQFGKWLDELASKH